MVYRDTIEPESSGNSHCGRLGFRHSVVVVAFGLFILGCQSETASSPKGSSLVNMVTQVPEMQRVGPWRVVALERRSALSAEDVAGLDITKDVLVQRAPVSRVVLNSPIHRGEALLMNVAYDRRWFPDSPDRGTQGSIEVRIRHEGDVVAAARQSIHGWTSEFTVQLPAAEGTTVELCFELPPGEEIPLNSIAAVALSLDAAPREVARAHTYLAWAARDHAHHSLVGLEQARVPISLKGCTRDALTLVDGDTLSFVLSPNPQGPSLVFWIGGLRIHSHVTSGLRIESKTGNEWISAGKIDKTSIPDFKWGAKVSIPVSADWSRVRFLYSGEGEVIALGMPHLISQSSGPTKPNVILIDLDTMRADRLNCYGYEERTTSERLDVFLRDKGFSIFRNAFSPASWTLPATAKFLCSRYLGFGQGSTVDQGYATMAEVLRDSGYYCVGFTGGGYLRIPGFEQGFHEYYWTEEYGKVEDTFPPAMVWVREQSIAPFFLFLHTYEPHTPFTRDAFCGGLPRGRLGDISKGEKLFPDEFTITTEVTAEESLFIQAAYDGGVKKACDATAELFSLMDSLALWDNTIVAILSDHGEEFWDHSASFAAHRYTSLYGELLNVPFMIYAPEMKEDGMKTVETPVTTVDLLPTIAQLVNASLSEPCDGISLCSLMSGRGGRRTVPILALNWPDERMNEHDRRTCVFFSDWKYIEQLGAGVDPAVLTRQGGYPPVDRELFRLDEDPSERRSLVPQIPAMTDSMAQLLVEGLRLASPIHSEASRGTKSSEVPQDLLKQLEALGYVDIEE